MPLTRDLEHAWLGGVCAGIAKHYQLPRWLLRLFWVLCVPFFGFSLLAYVVLLVIMIANERAPGPPAAAPTAPETPKEPPK
jgi:phage shock protein PspC (stress-responsive transcriptional regulator)